MHAIGLPHRMLSEIVRAVHILGSAIRSVVPAEPAPCWTEYLRETRAERF